MALGTSFTVALDGVLAHVVSVEANVGRGLPGIHVVGLGDAAIGESRARIRTAVSNSGLPWPKTKIVVSMSPASLPKSGSHFDLPMALAILGAGEGVSKRLERALVLGELSLDGRVRPVSGIVPAIIAAGEGSFDTLVIPCENAAEAALVPEMNVLVARTLIEAFEWALGRRDLPRATDVARSAERQPGAGEAAAADFCDIAGQAQAKWAAEVAAAGGHHLLMIGPPGTGKSMVASRLPTILPPLSTQESVEVTAIHSIAGTPGSVISRPPFIAPHPSVTRAALLGGGSGAPRPGAVSMAHRGVLFLDEVSEVAAAVLDGLRAPLEEGCVRLARGQREVVFPALFQLVLAANPCHCAAEDPSKCTCRSAQRANYLSNLSGPLLDRLDICVELSGRSAIIDAGGEETSAEIAQRVAQARQRALGRWRSEGLRAALNSEVPAAYLRRHRPAAESAMALLAAYLSEGQLTQRGLDRVLRLSWTLADLAGAARPGLEEVSRALDLRGTPNIGRLAA